MLEFSLDSSRRIFYAGECITVFLESTEKFPEGNAFLRTNLGMATLRRHEIIDEVENYRRRVGKDWHDLAMQKVSSTRYELKIMLTENGIFELKPFFSPLDKSMQLCWPGGSNLKLKVESADNIGANLIYTAFVRQFGKNISNSQTVDDKLLNELDKKNYTVVPPSGTFRDLKNKLDFIFGTLGCRILQLLPIHPTPTVYGRMGRFGSPFAALDYFAVDPALAEFDECATPLEQFGELVDAVHARKGRIFLDIPVNHTGWASRLQTEHPEWFVRDSNKRIESPGAWGVVWADLCKLDYSQKPVQRYMAEVFLYWCRKGVDGFRCDAGYMLPQEAWYYIEAKVRNEYPDTVFMLEGLGGPQDKQDKLLGECGLDWAYSELFQNYSRSEVEHYSASSRHTAGYCGTLINFAETHDNNRLAATGKTFADMRCALMCFMSDAGTFGFTNGVEWYAAEKVDVHGASSLNWGSQNNMIGLLQRLHGIMRLHPAFYGGAEKSWINLAPTQALAIRRKRGSDEVLALINLDWRNPAQVLFPANMWQTIPNYDLISGEPYNLSPAGCNCKAELAPGEFRLLSADKTLLEQLDCELKSPFRTPELIRRQKLELALGKALDAAGIPLDGDTQKLFEDFRRDPARFLRKRPVVEFCDRIDTNRLVMIPENWCLAIRSQYAFRAELKTGDKTLRFERSVRLSDQSYFALFAPLTADEIPQNDPILELTCFEPAATVRRQSHLRFLPGDDTNDPVQLHFSASDLQTTPPRHALGVNELGGYMQAAARWGELVSKYDALLAANLNTDYPVDRCILLARCKVWLVLNGFSQELNFALQERFRVGKRNLARWEFDVPMGQGKSVKLDITARFSFNANAVKLEFRRRPAGNSSRMLTDDIPITMIVRCQIDHRENHALTHAYISAEHAFPNAITALENGFIFEPSSGCRLSATISQGKFFREDEWHYMQDFLLENYYGLEHKSDLYSPGYFSVELNGSDCRILEAAANIPDAEAIYPEPDRFPANISTMDAAYNALSAFVVKRNEFRTVIAGYPWFLDWGRDTLIALRGLIAAGKLEESREILLQFAGFEKHGTIPNMIRGSNDSNRETSDAPLWLAVALSDYMRVSGDRSILECAVGKHPRSVLEVIESIAFHYRNGTGNGIFADKESNLIYSPPHYTWMDTNYPAATPRAGYPIEIQALWFALQNLLAAYNSDYRSGAETTRDSIKRLFYLEKYQRFSDCLHANADTPAAQAVPDNAVRPNALFAVTLKAIDEPDLMEKVLASTEKLLIPGAIRSLGNFKVEPPLPVKLHGMLLNDPDFPYKGSYCGPEDTSRKAAYHNGTAWCWPFPSYPEALYMTYGDEVLPAARAILRSAASYFNDGCPGQLPEVADGDYPHNWGGCAAQAWSVSEFYRVGKLLGM